MVHEIEERKPAPARKTADHRAGGPIRARSSPRGLILLYAGISLCCFLGGLGILLLLIFQADRLNALGLVGHLYYLVLLPLGLAVAGFLFGTLRSYARYRGRQFGGTLELGGPMVGFALVVIGGFTLVPSRSGSFPLTVFVHGKEGPEDLVLPAGTVHLRLGGTLHSAVVGTRGQAFFPAIPAEYRHQPITMTMEAEGFEVIRPIGEIRLEGTSFDLVVARRPIRLCGRIRSEGGKVVPSGRVSTVGGIITQSDATGYFELIIPGDRWRSELPVQVDAPGYRPWNGTAVPGSNDLIVVLKPWS